MSKVKRLPVVEVEWVDSMGTSGWQPRESALAEAGKAEDLAHRSAGYLLKHDRVAVTVALSVGDGVPNVSGLITIPRCAVRSMTVLRK